MSPGLKAALHLIGIIAITAIMVLTLVGLLMITPDIVLLVLFGIGGPVVVGFIMWDGYCELRDYYRGKNG